ncbi:hypothetical protein [Pseudonocardia endophytica]|uniref:hypothetical protein n=1 Tax=Pseudonocardia endophytica TaxID=401976 RepID=UPI0010479C63|nr:hypothetical protein [Pseudonocardia endophytica]
MIDGRAATRSHIERPPPQPLIMNAARTRVRHSVTDRRRTRTDPHNAHAPGEHTRPDTRKHRIRPQTPDRTANTGSTRGRRISTRPADQRANAGSAHVPAITTPPPGRDIDAVIDGWAATRSRIERLPPQSLITDAARTHDSGTASPIAVEHALIRTTRIHPENTRVRTRANTESGRKHRIGPRTPDQRAAGRSARERRISAQSGDHHRASGRDKTA